jgi:hypothetical protein
VLEILGIVFNLLGSLSLARGLFISKYEATQLGMSRWGAETDKENLQLPAVRDRLRQRKWGSIGAILLLIGSAFLILGRK